MTAQAPTQAPAREPGGGKLEPLADAPGEYVRVRVLGEAAKPSPNPSIAPISAANWSLPHGQIRPSDRRAAA